MSKYKSDKKTKSKTKTRSKSRSKHERRHKSRHESEDDSNIDDFQEDDFYSDEDVQDYNNQDEEYTDQQQDEQDDQNDQNDQEVSDMVEAKISNKTRERLKKKITHWLDYDDKIKELNNKTKKYKDAKKQQEETILKMLNKLGVGENKIDVHDRDDNLRGRVYKHKSVTTGAIKGEIIQKVLMEVIRNEKAVSQLVKKIEEARPQNERYYLKRTKGNKE
ncbi:hypothetical protein QKC54_gp0363 [Megavirus baoshan]|uniref:Uncharacterized protein n=1 Tax=Megavirus baoshan TaxID=2496520 RepID=A0A3Q8U819_9VIRU|nr:hypothetical protein QKC54_gp0363 [Megavirus baoshan]AZL89460.1 hypothetical protein Mb0709 [Megavirus baoshan]